MQKEKFRIITYPEVIKIKTEKKGEFFGNIPFNNSSVYILNDSTFILLPLNPYAEALLVCDKEGLDEMIKTSTFPVKDELNTFYDIHKEEIDNLNIHGDELISELKSYLKDHNFTIDENEKTVDSVYNFLKKEKSLEKYKLNFLIFLTYHIIENYDNSLRIGLLQDKQTLNPIVSIILVKQTGDDLTYFNLENHIFSRSGYYGLHEVISSFNAFNKKPNSIAEIKKIFK
jgi:hypothetical protein